MIRPTIAALALSALLLLALPGRSPAEPGSIRIVSKTASEQADFAEAPAISGNGEFVAFVGSISGRRGIFRADVLSGEVVPVVTSDAYAFPFTDASDPSISADGRYVSFTTSARLDPADDQGESSSDVYVADLATTPPTYELASALDGSAQGLTYVGRGGSVAAGRVALSADGRQVAFMTTAPSDLGGAAEDTPAGQVVLRDLATGETKLIGVERDPLTGGMKPGVPVAGGAALEKSGVVPGAAISADGSTVSWIGTHLGAQVPLAPAEAESIARFEGSEGYDEPLWRRVPSPADPAPATRRLVAAAYPAIVTGKNRTAADSCTSLNGWELDRIPAQIEPPTLSADGDAVALVGEPDGYSDVFAVQIGADEAVPPTVRRLTRAVTVQERNACSFGEPAFISSDGIVQAAAISPDGDRVAFTTRRRQFPLSPPNLVGAPPFSLGLAELYLADLGDSTLQRLTHGATPAEPSLVAGREPGEGGATAVSFAEDNETVAFASKASNLVAGDGNGELEGENGGGDAFVVVDPRPTSGRGHTSVSAPPPGLRTVSRRRLSATAHSLPNGAVRIAVSVPGSGGLRAKATTVLAVGRHPSTVVAKKTRARSARVIKMTLKAPSRFGRQVHAKGGLEATLALRFSSHGEPPLRDALEIHFRRRGKPDKGGGR